MKIGYARVSTRGQAREGTSLEAQEEALLAAGADKVYKEAFTGTRVDRPELQKVLSELKTGDTLIVTKLDRIARSAAKGSELVTDLLNRGVKVHILNMGLLDNSPAGKLVLTVMLAFAEFERDLIVDRTQEGRIMARLNNPDYREGRKTKYTKRQIENALQMLRTNSYREVESITGISKSTLVREKRKAVISK
ncbi:MAG: recombinase family protein [Eubacterium sp.]|nr:recombinase family protein [Eubacterium sp.]MCH4047391.1 recombinase family protein [Eubacterium sp.]MCH4080488.1 recombinase family protein [Eubacterium sp.]MCI1308025.1 recombinase family protein [Eubacterium sp.]